MWHFPSTCRPRRWKKSLRKRKRKCHRHTAVNPCISDCKHLGMWLAVAKLCLRQRDGVRERRSDGVTEWLSDGVIEWLSDGVIEWLSDRETERQRDGVIVHGRNVIYRIQEACSPPAGGLNVTEWGSDGVRERRRDGVTERWSDWGTEWLCTAGRRFIAFRNRATIW
jgi:hypothetical protein